MGVFEKDLKKATFGSLPVTLILLLLAFGSLVAAGVPLLLAITSVLVLVFQHGWGKQLCRPR